MNIAYNIIYNYYLGHFNTNSILQNLQILAYLIKAILILYSIIDLKTLCLVIYLREYYIY